MMQWVAQRHVQNGRHAVGRAGQQPAWRTDFLKPPAGSYAPQAFLIEYAPSRVLETHFHDSDEFQIVVGGDGRLGRHAIAPLLVHFARAYTAYGPIVAGAQGLTFVTLRARRDSMGPQRVSERGHVLEQMPGRQPWQTSDAAQFDDVASTLRRPLAGVRDDHGLAASTVHLPSRGRLQLDATGGDGRFVLLLEGDLVTDGEHLHAMSIGYSASGDGTTLIAGDAGLRALVLDFPQPLAHDVAPSVHAPTTWHCDQCGFVYDEAAGLDGDGILPGTPWADVSADWQCPDCLADKSKFRRGMA